MELPFSACHVFSRNTKKSFCRTSYPFFSAYATLEELGLFLVSTNVFSNWNWSVISYLSSLLNNLRFLIAVTMSVTIERYFAIVHPLKHFSGKKFLLISPIALTIIYNVPKFFELERGEVSRTAAIKSTKCISLALA